MREKTWKKGFGLEEKRQSKKKSEGSVVYGSTA